MKFKAYIFAVLFTGIIPCTVVAEFRPFEIANSDTINLTDKENGRTYEIYIKFPIKYNKQTKYPVIYMTDARYTFPTVSGSTGVPMSAKKIENAFLVGISWQKNLSPKASRIRDYTPTKVSSWKHHTGEADSHITFIRNEVIPFVEKNYATDNSKRTYLGNSLGGLLGAYILLTQPDMFTNYVLASPSLWYDNELLLKMATNYSANDLKANVFISVGELEHPETGETIHDMVSVAEQFYNLLSLKKYHSLSLKLNIVKSANHEVAFPTSAIQGLFWLSRKNI